jgi:hypothetical protein
MYAVLFRVSRSWGSRTDAHGMQSRKEICPHASCGFWLATVHAENECEIWDMHERGQASKDLAFSAGNPSLVQPRKVCEPGLQIMGWEKHGLRERSCVDVLP